jgi:hypothetical protein
MQTMLPKIVKASWLARLLLQTIDSQSFHPILHRGQAVVINGCSFLIFLKSCINDDPLPQVLKAKHVYQETYRLNPDGGGVSIKLASNKSIGTAAGIATAFDQSHITQFEYTYTPHIHLASSTIYPTSMEGFHTLSQPTALNSMERLGNAQKVSPNGSRGYMLHFRHPERGIFGRRS